MSVCLNKVISKTFDQNNFKEVFLDYWIICCRITVLL